MKSKRKGSNVKRTPLKDYCTTGESLTTTQRYKKLSFEAQFKLLDRAFFKGCFTMKTVSINVDIDRANICRFVAKRRKENRIYLVKYGICPITKNPGVGFYTTNFELFNLQKYSNNEK